MSNQAKKDTEQAQEARDQALEIARLPLRVIRYGRIILHIRESRIRQVEYHETIDVPEPASE